MLLQFGSDHPRCGFRRLLRIIPPLFLDKVHRCFRNHPSQHATYRLHRDLDRQKGQRSHLDPLARYPLRVLLYHARCFHREVDHFHNNIDRIYGLCRLVLFYRRPYQHLAKLL